MSELQSGNGKAVGRLRLVLARLFHGVPLRTLEAFYFQLGTILTSGVPIQEALRSLTKQMRGRFRATLGEIADRVSTGDSLTAALEGHPAIFDRFAVAMVRTGEMAGRLDENLQLLGKTAEGFRKTRSMVLTGLLYPLVLLHLGVLIPNFVVLVNEGLLPYLFVCLLTLLPLYGFVFLLWLAHQMLRPTLWYSTFSLKVIVTGTVARQIALARFSRALSALHDAGVELGSAVETAGSVTGNVALEDAFSAVAGRVRAGNTLSDSILGAPWLTDLTRNMIQTGESTGRLGETLNKLADYYESASRTAIERFVRIAPIIVYLMVAGYIAVKVISFYTDLYAPYIGR